MTSLRKQFTLVLFTLLFSGILASGQTSIDLNFQGLLTDADGASFASENFDFTVKLISSEPGRGDLWSQSEAISTDENGWLTFFIPEISQYLNMEEDEKNSVVVRMEFSPNSSTTWLGQGEDFLITYTLTPTKKDETIHLKMSRMDGIELTDHLEDHLYAFKDEYPFAFLTGGFLLTDAPPLDKSSIDDLKQWISPDLSESDPATRGVKGGFPKGGYRKR